MPSKPTAILYHGSCPDGLGGAYAAWKKFGEDADYIPAKYNRPIPENIERKDLYFIDFCYPEEIMDSLAKTGKSITVLDHHEGAKAVATKFPGTFDSSHSGAVIAWEYFHPATKVPSILLYIEDGDLYRFALPYSREILSYLDADQLSSFEQWDVLAKAMEDPEERAKMISIGRLFLQYHDRIVASGVNHAEIVSFEGYECYLAGAGGEFISDTGHTLALRKPPFALVISADAGGVRVSLRGDGTVDVAAIARKYGGNGHPAAAGFRIPFGNPIPWQSIEQRNENPSD